MNRIVPDISDYWISLRDSTGRGPTETMTRGRRLSLSFYRQATNWLLPTGVQDLLLRSGKRIIGTRFVFLACFPKSGSTLLSESLSGLPGWTQSSSIPSDWTREQEPIHEYIARDWIAVGRNIVFKNHVSHSEYLSSLFERYNMHCVFLVRNLPDVCCSLSDHFDQESVTLPFVALNNSQLDRIDDSNDRARFIIDLAIPWYINCYVSWMRYISDGGRCQIVRYEDLAGDTISTIGQIITAVDIEHSADEIQTAVRRAGSLPNKSRFNVGTVGRGRDYLNKHPHTEETLRRYISYYPDIDFSPVFDD